MIHHLLVTEVGSQICVAQLSFDERTKILGRAHFCRKFLFKSNSNQSKAHLQ